MKAVRRGVHTSLQSHSARGDDRHRLLSAPGERQRVDACAAHGAVDGVAPALRLFPRTERVAEANEAGVRLKFREALDVAAQPLHLGSTFFESRLPNIAVRKG